MMIIDSHSHVLPGIDDGSTCVEESMAMLRTAAEQGVQHIIATPHFYARHDDPERFLSRRARAEDELRAAMSREPDLPELHVGAEVYYFPGIGSSDILPRLTIGGSPYILIEMPQAPWSEAVYRELHAIRANHGLVPVVAHVDRYIRPLKTHHIPQRLSQMPVLVQANAEFFLDRSTRRMALRMLEANQIHLLGSDCHDLASRAPNLGAALAVIGKHSGESALRALAETSAELLSSFSAEE